MEKDNILEVRNLNVAFGDRTVVENLNFTLRRGETLGIVGESGSGKSVSTLSLMGLLPRTAKISGQAMMANAAPSLPPIDLLSLDETQMQSIRGGRISMIFQEPMTSLNPVQKCGEQVMEMFRAHNNDASKQRVIELFHEVLLPRPEKIFDSYPHEISGGQKQRVMIAMALVNNPDILVADEPTTALDVTVQRTILDLLKSLQSKYNIAIIFITHDLGVISQVADRIMVMYRGHIVEQGDAQQLLHHPQQPYTQGLLACRPPLDSKPERLPTVEDFLEGVNGSEKGGNESERTNAQDSATVHSLLSAKNLDVTYTLKRSLFGRPLQTLKAVDGLTFDIMEGETLGLVGESGCGKSTLGRALLRLIDHSLGSIAYRGQSLDTLSRRQMKSLRPKLQIIFQDPYSSLNPRITIGEAIAEPLKVHRITQDNPKGRVLELMQQVGLEPEWYDRYPHEFSDSASVSPEPLYCSPNWSSATRACPPLT